MAGFGVLRPLLLSCLGAWLLAENEVAAERIVPGVLEQDVFLEPKKAKEVKVAIGQAKFLRFRCNGGPADVVISFSTFAEHADPLLFLSLDPRMEPSFKQHDASSFGQWREDAAGDHYVIAKAVGPAGGILGLVNMPHFAGEEIYGVLSIHCTFIVAFDTLFWDHLRSAAVCPWGSALQDPSQQKFCSGNGQCSQQGVCECDGNHMGPACEHLKADMVVAAEGKYRFQVATGRYQYFRVRVPPRFAGGYLEVHTIAEQPLVVLVRTDDLPTKTNYELSNFDAWVNSENTSVLQFKVQAPAGAPTMPGDNPWAPPGLRQPGGGAGYGGWAGPPQDMPMGPPGGIPGMPPGIPGQPGLPPPVGGPGYGAGGIGRRLTAWWGEGREVTSWFDLFSRHWDARTIDLEPEASGADALLRHRSAERRRLQGEAEAIHGNPGLLNPPQVSCPNLPPKSSQACTTPTFKLCEARCMTCVSCIKGSTDDTSCASACDACVEPGCINALGLCAGNTSCEDQESMHCQERCGSCMSCFNSNDERCQTGCGCCSGCLPIAAKCSAMSQQGRTDAYNRFVFVGVYNHRRYQNDRDIVHAVAVISLKSDPDFSRNHLPNSWMADLYNPFQDMRNYQISDHQIYPDGEQFIYQIDLIDYQKMHEQVRLYHDRATLILVKNSAQATNVVLSFPHSGNITHVLSSLQTAPKTLFDFDAVHTPVNGIVTLETDKPAIWCAIWGAADGYVQVAAQTHGEVPAAPVPIGFALVCVFGLLCALLVLGVIYGGAQKLSERVGVDPSVPVSDRLANWGLGRGNPHESTASLTRTGSLSGYMGSEVIDRSVEDQYLHRGGIGDDGI